MIWIVVAGYVALGIFFGAMFGTMLSRGLVTEVSLSIVCGIGWVIILPFFLLWLLMNLGCDAGEAIKRRWM